MIELNQVYTHDFQFTQDDVIKFADVTGDHNPVHLDPVYAATTLFKKPIIHGMLGAAVFSKVFGTLFPGDGTIYLKQSLSFRNPLYVGTAYQAVFTVLEVEKEKNRLTIETLIKETGTGTLITKGEATVMVTPDKLS